MACLRSSSMPACWRWRSISSRPRFEPGALLACAVEIGRGEPTPIGAAEPRPIAIDDGEPDGIAALAFDHHVLAEIAFALEAEAQGGALRAAIARIAFPFDTAIAPALEALAEHEEDRLGCAAALLQGRGEENVSELDHAMASIDAHEAHHAERAAPLIDDGEEQRVRGVGAGAKPEREIGPADERPDKHEIPEPRVVAGSMCRCVERGGVAARLQRLEAHIATADGQPHRFARRPPAECLGCHRKLLRARTARCNP